jgi:hypothetical protein
MACLAVGLCLAADDLVVTNKQLAVTPNSGTITIGHKTITVTDVDPLAGTQTLTSVLARIEPMVEDYAHASTTAQKDEITNRLKSEMKKRIDDQPLRFSTTIQDVKVIDDHTAAVRFSDIECDGCFKQSKPRFSYMWAFYDIRLDMPKNDAMALKANSKVVVLGRCTFSPDAQVPVFLPPNSKTPIVFHLSAGLVAFCNLGTVSLNDPEIHISNATYRLK